MKLSDEVDHVLREYLKGFTDWESYQKYIKNAGKSYPWKSTTKLGCFFIIHNNSGLLKSNMSHNPPQVPSLRELEAEPQALEPGDTMDLDLPGIRGVPFSNSNNGIADPKKFSPCLGEE